MSDVFCNKCGFSGQADERGNHKRPSDGEVCHYVARTRPQPAQKGKTIMGEIDQLRPLTGAEFEVLWCLFKHGPTWDGNLPSKCGRDDLFSKRLIDRYDGWQWLTRGGMMLALDLELDRKKGW